MSNTSSVTLTERESPALRNPPFENMVWVPGGTFLMGSDKHYPEEAPAHEVTVDGFWMDRYTVTNEEFRKFVEATKHVTSAERAPKADDYPGAQPELLVPASVVFNKPRQGWTCEIVTTGGSTCLERTGAILRDRRAHSREKRNILSCTLHTRMLKPTRNGSVKSYRRRLNGSSPLEEG